MTSQVDLDDKAVRVEDVAELFDVKPYTVREWLKSGRLQGFKTPGGQWRIKKSVVQAFAQELYGE